MVNFERKLQDIIDSDNYESNEITIKTLLSNKEPIVIFGAGKAGSTCYDKLIEWNCKSKIVFCDNYKIGVHKGVEIISFNDLISNEFYANAIIIVAIGGNGFNEVYSQLKETNIPDNGIIFRDYISDKVKASYIKSNIYNLKKIYEKLCDNLSKEVFWRKVENSMYCRINMDDVYIEGAIQYIESFIELNDNEVFVDCGGYIGDTVLTFMEKTNNKYKYIYSFEPEKENYEIMKNNLSNYDNISMVNKGLWNKEANLRFNIGGASSNVNVYGETEVSVTCIDNILNEGNIPTFIKMDIEGSELMALQGARNTISKYRPKLAICIYHKPEDILEIPMLINEINPTYKYFLRHYEPGYSNSETVLYAI